MTVELREKVEQLRDEAGNAAVFTVLSQLLAAEDNFVLQEFAKYCFNFGGSVTIENLRVNDSRPIKKEIEKDN